jgi:hypothetical protein
MLLRSEFDERSPQFSPDGRWFAYSSDEPGQTEIFVRRFPVTEETWRVSTSGGQQPAWNRNGKEIFFVSPDGRFMAAPVATAGTTLSIGAPQALFRSPVRLNSVTNQYAVSADGQRFLFALPTEDFVARPSARSRGASLLPRLLRETPRAANRGWGRKPSETPHAAS